jgi:hypothetical protein
LLSRAVKKLAGTDPKQLISEVLKIVVGHGKIGRVFKEEIRRGN